MDQAIQAALLETARIKQPTGAIRKSTYQSLEKLFEKVAKEGSGISMSAAAGIGESLKQVLFGPDAGSEALRLLRAEAVVQICRAAPSIGPALRDEVARELQEEKSTVVRDRLAAAVQL